MVTRLERLLLVCAVHFVWEILVLAWGCHGRWLGMVQD